MTNIAQKMRMFRWRVALVGVLTLVVVLVLWVWGWLMPYTIGYQKELVSVVPAAGIADMTIKRDCVGIFASEGAVALGKLTYCTHTSPCSRRFRVIEAQLSSALAAGFPVRAHQPKVRRIGLLLRWGRSTEPFLVVAICRAGGLLLVGQWVLALQLHAQSCVLKPLLPRRD